MIILPLFALMIVLGVGVGRWSTLSLPLLLGVALAALFAMSGYLWDSPVVAMVLLAEFGTGLGVVLRRRMDAARSVTA